MLCENRLGGCYQNVSVLEHVVVQVTLSFQGDDAADGQRGKIKMDLTSPRGTTSTILPHRFEDTGSEGYNEWPFLSVHFWGEYPTGTWNLTVFNTGEKGTVRVSGLSLILYGTTQPPPSIKSDCDSSCVNGCWGTDSKSCVQCRNLRNADTLECIDECPEGSENTHGYCVTVNECSECELQKRNGEECLCGEGLFVDSGTSSISLATSLWLVMSSFILNL